ncbi:mCG15301, isoform CRA_e, partial [Mus musculus]
FQHLGGRCLSSKPAWSTWCFPGQLRLCVALGAEEVKDNPRIHNLNLILSLSGLSPRSGDH